VILTEADSVVVWCNRTAQEILRRADGLHTHRGHLMAEHPEANRDLRELLRRAASGDWNGRFGGVTAVPRRSVVDSYSVLAAPPPPHNGALDGIVDRTLAVVFLCDQAQVVKTPAEARLTVGLMARNRLPDAADLLEITEGTARPYLRRVLHKTGAQRQSDLVRVVLSGLVPLAAFADDVRPLESKCEGIDR
jgi:DNA-binding CsgD family transcriptional regulator